MKYLLKNNLKKTIQKNPKYSLMRKTHQKILNPQLKNLKLWNLLKKKKKNRIYNKKLKKKTQKFSWSNNNSHNKMINHKLSKLKWTFNNNQAKFRRKRNNKEFMTIKDKFSSNLSTKKRNKKFHKLKKNFLIISLGVFKLSLLWNLSIKTLILLINQKSIKLFQLNNSSAKPTLVQESSSRLKAKKK